MPFRNGRSGTDAGKNKLRVNGAAVMLAIFLIGCNFGSSFLNPALKPSPPGPGMTWRETESPLFPTSWPPTPGTTWVRYTFAYGNNPANLSDGTYVSNPLSRTELKTDGSSKTTVLSKDMTQAGVQGVLPLGEQETKILQNGKQISAACLKLTELPDPKLASTQDMLAYYRAWFKYNGAFLDLIRKNHTAFIDWVTAAK